MGAVPARKRLGTAAELAAVAFLKKTGYRILARNFSTSLGEVDIIAADGSILCFIEVRSRADGATTPPYETIGPRKQRRVRAAARAFLERKRSPNALCRFDVLSLVPDAQSGGGWDVTLMRDAF